MIRKTLCTATVLGVLVFGGFANAAPPPCEPGSTTGGCKTVDDESKNNPKFVETQRGNVDAPGTESTCTGANRGQTKQVC